MSQILNYQNIILAIVVGFLPAVFWLWFFLKEDCHPEPKWMIVYTFLAGMAVIPIALIVEKFIFDFFLYLKLATFDSYPILLLFLWSAVEEYLKYAAANKTALKKKVFDEPVDALIYLIVAALGFAAFENILFALKNFGGNDNLLASFISGNFRFLGPTLLHVAASSMVGASIAFSFFHKEHMKRNVAGGLILAVLLHTIFNYFIMKSKERDILEIFLLIWVIIILILFLFEKIKRLKN